MPAAYTYPKFDYRKPEELSSKALKRYPVVVVGAGPVGLAAAIDMAQRGQPVLLLDEDDTVSIGSRGLCYARRAIEVLDRLGCGQPVVDKGVTWDVGRTFFDTQEVFSFNLSPEPGHERPGMVNLQQYYLEDYQIARAKALPNLEMRFKHKVIKVEPGKALDGQGAKLEVETPDGNFALEADWLIVADGARSPIRHMMGLEIEGKVFQDRFLIADVRMSADFPAERWFWFDPPFHRNQSVLLHRQADSVWRIDFQLGWDADPEEEKKPEKVIPRIKAMLGDDRKFDLEWVSIYTFQCRRMTSFRHGRVLFAGDAAHQVSPFGARGANSGYQDTDNLCWKLQAVIEGRAPDSLLDTYSMERTAAADENIMNSTRSTDFITPKSAVSKLFRNAVLGLARQHEFARALVNSGRLSVPAHYSDSPLNTPDADAFEGWMRPGAPMDDAPVTVGNQQTWLLRQIAHDDPKAFTLLVFGNAPVALPANLPAPVIVRRIAANDITDREGWVTRRYDGKDGTAYLLRPDQHVATRWRAFDAAALTKALNKALNIA